MATGIAPSRQTHDIAAVLRMVASVNSREQLADVLQEACRVVVELLGVDHSGIVVFSDDGTYGTVAAQFPREDEFDGFRIPVDGIPDEVMLLSGKGFKYEDVSKATGLGCVRDALLALGVQSVLVEPIVCGGKVVASFSVDCIKDARNFGALDEGICKAFAEMLGFAYAKASQLEVERKNPRGGGESMD